TLLALLSSACFFLPHYVDVASQPSFPTRRSSDLAVLMESPLPEPEPLTSLIEALRRLPGVGVRSARRMAYHLLQHDIGGADQLRSEEHTSELQSRENLVCSLLLATKKHGCACGSI